MGEIGNNHWEELAYKIFSELSSEIKSLEGGQLHVLSGVFEALCRIGKKLDEIEEKMK